MDDDIQTIATNVDNTNDEDLQADELDTMLNDYIASSTLTKHQHGNEQHGRRENISENVKKFYKYVEDAQQPLYPGSKITKLSAIVRLFQLKVDNGWTNKSFDLLLDLLQTLLPEGAELPKSFYHTKKIITDLEFHYVKIDACPNDCMLYWKDTIDVESCTICGESRWKLDENSGKTVSSSLKKKKIPVKILCHFPIIPRLQKLFMSSKTSDLLR